MGRRAKLTRLKGIMTSAVAGEEEEEEEKGEEEEPPNHEGVTELITADPRERTRRNEREREREREALRSIFRKYRSRFIVFPASNGEEKRLSTVLAKRQRQKQRGTPES